MRSIRPLLEPLESRTLLSAAPIFAPLFTNIGHAGPEAPIGGLAHGPVLRKGIGHNITVVAGSATTVEVAFFPAPVLDPPMVYSASIDWGDGATSTATLTYATENGKGGYQITGTHAYATAGTFKIATVVVESTTPSTTGASATPIRLVSRIASKAIVSAQGTSSSIALRETVNSSFTADLGSFTAAVHTVGLKATILWGDGQSSAATLTPAPHGTDAVSYQVTGTHAYAQVGTYFVQVNIIRGHSHALSSLDSTVVVTNPQHTLLAGALSGTYESGAVVFSTVADDFLTGSGTAGTLGNVTATGEIIIGNSPFSPIPTSGLYPLQGNLTLSNAFGSITLNLAASAINPLAISAASLTYTFAAATGAYANIALASGTLNLTLTPSTATFGGAFGITLP